MTATPRHVIAGTGGIGLADLEALTDEVGVGATPVQPALADTRRGYRDD
jgi:hypothetical protein